MADFAYIRSHLAGAWEVMNGRDSGLRRLDLSADGFWRSFLVLLLILPLVGIATIGQRVIGAEVGATMQPVSGAYISWTVFGAVVDWLSFPLVFGVLARPLGLSRTFVAFIVARNWSALITAGIAAAVYLIYALRLLPAETAPYAILLVLIVTLRFSYKVARVALDAPVSVALPVVVLDLLLSVLVQALLGGV